MEPVQCPVCTLFLREGITLDSHLDTHPKDQVIRALCAITRSFAWPLPSPSAGAGAVAVAGASAPPPPPPPPPQPQPRALCRGEMRNVVVIKPFAEAPLPKRPPNVKILSDIKIETPLDGFSVIKPTADAIASSSRARPRQGGPVNVITFGSCSGAQPWASVRREAPPEERFSFADIVRRSYETNATTATTVPVEFETEQSETIPIETEASVVACSEPDIRTDEIMPPRGELSEQESSGDTDAPWAGVYRDMCGSTSYDMLTRETWHSDGSDIDITNHPIKSNFDDVDDMPIVVSVKPPDKNYKCATCGMAFNCPKERRVHRTKEHSTIMSSSDSVLIKRDRRKQIFIKSSIKIEKIVKTECILSTPPKINYLEDSSNKLGDICKIDIKPLNDVVNKELESIESKPSFDILKLEVKKKGTPYLCVTCKLEFPSDYEFKEHLKIHPLECLTCGKLFKRRASLQLHIKRHLGIRNFRCDVCEKRFITRQKLMEHYNIHTGNAPIKCNLCELTFRRHSNMTQHRNVHHFKIKRKFRDYICTCGEVFMSKKKLAWHKEIHDDKPKSCLHCNEKFIHMASLTRHVRRAHNNFFVPDDKRKNENVTCPECKNVYLKSTIDMHMKIHTGNKPFSCVICNKSFTTKWNLKLHKWTHANRSNKPFKCTLCKGAFIRQSDYISHMNAHKSVRPYTCNYCGCQFIRKYNCQRHVKEHENEKKYLCDVPDCGKSFHRSYYLTEHLRVHSGIRPFSCNICGKTSSTKSNHNKHVKIHHAREPITTEG